MIQATFVCNSANQLTKFVIEGHADSGPYGQDIVCAAVSVIGLGTINSLQTVSQIKPQVNSQAQSGGYLECQVDYSQITVHDQLIQTQTLMANCYQILHSLVDNYGDFIRVDLKQETVGR